MRNLAISLSFAVAVLYASAASAVEYTFEKILIPGTRSTGITDINNLGNYVGAYTNPDFTSHAFYFDGSEYVTFDFPGADYLVPTSINDHGVIAGYYEIDDRKTGFLFENGEFTSIALAGARSTQFRGLNNDGVVVGAYTREDFSGFGFALERDGTLRELIGPDGEYVSPAAIANDGAILGRISIPSDDTPDPVQGLLIEGSNYTVIPRYGNYSLVVEDLTDDHVVVGSVSSYFGINVFGIIVEHDAFSYISAPNSLQTYVSGINNDGVIVGHYLSDSGEKYGAFIARPVPEPSSWILALVTLLGTAKKTSMAEL